MKSIYKLGGVALVALLSTISSCQKEDATGMATPIASETTTDRAMIAATEQVAKSLVSISDNTAIQEELIAEVNKNATDGRDERIPFDEFENNHTLFLSALKKIISPELQSYMTNNKMELYYPYAQISDRSKPATITFNPTNEEYTNLTENIGFVKDGNSFKQVIVDGEYASQNPVWIIRAKYEDKKPTINESLLSSIPVTNSENSRQEATMVSAPVATTELRGSLVADQYRFNVNLLDNSSFKNIYNENGRGVDFTHYKLATSVRVKQDAKGNDVLDVAGNRIPIRVDLPIACASLSCSVSLSQLRTERAAKQQFAYIKIKAGELNAFGEINDRTDISHTFDIIAFGNGQRTPLELSQEVHTQGPLTATTFNLTLGVGGSITTPTDATGNALKGQGSKGTDKGPDLKDGKIDFNIQSSSNWGATNTYTIKSQTTLVNNKWSMTGLKFHNADVTNPKEKNSLSRDFLPANGSTTWAVGSADAAIHLKRVNAIKSSFFILK